VLRISSRGRYGVKAVFELARRFGQAPMPLAAVARAQGVPEPYLEQLMPPLKRAGIVAAERGAQGGYRLARRPRDVTVADVIRALEGPIHLTTCTSNEAEDCPALSECIGPDVWTRVQEVLVAAMDAMSFDDLIQRQRASTMAGQAWTHELLAEKVGGGP
jgi:Rrf2 family cysteine metabolism transcriptional repressor